MTKSSSSLWKNISHVCAVAVAGYFIYAAQFKIVEPRQFVIDIRNYRMMPDTALNLMAIILPWIEVGAALALIVPYTRRAGALLIAGMLLMFVCAVSYAALYKGYNIKCGCTGHNSGKAGYETIGLDSFLLVLTYFAAFTRGAAVRRGFPVVTDPTSEPLSAAVV